MQDIHIQIEDLQTYFHNIELKAPGYRKIRFQRKIFILLVVVGVSLICLSLVIKGEFNPFDQSSGFVTFFNENYWDIRGFGIILFVLGLTRYSELTRSQNTYRDYTKNYLIRANMTGAPKPLEIVFNAEGIRTFSTFGYRELQWAYFSHFEIYKGTAFVYHTYHSYFPDITAPLNLLTQEETNQLTELLVKNLKPRNK